MDPDTMRDPREFDIVELCVDSQFYRGNVAKARATWMDGFKHGYKGEAYHSGSFFTTDVNRYINDQNAADLEKWKTLKAEYDDAMVEVLDDKEAREKLKEPKRPRRSLKGYKGEHWSPFFMLDIDTRREGPKWELVKEGGEHKWRKRSNEEEGLWRCEHSDYVEDRDAARIEALEVIRCLEKLGVAPELLVICFSGNKGFHIYVPTATFNPEPCDNFIYRIRWMVQHALVPMVDKEKIPFPEDSIDWQVFDRLKVLRAVNSKHQSGLYKYPLAYRTLQSTSFDKIKERADRPHLDYQHPKWFDVEPSDELGILWENPECAVFKKPSPKRAPVEKKAGTKRERTEEQDHGRREFDHDGRASVDASVLKINGPVPSRPLCMVKIGQEDVGSGNRHQGCLMLLTTWWKEGYTAEQSFKMACDWFELQVGTRHDMDYVQRQVDSIYDDTFNWGCNHPLAKANCFKQCTRFPQSDDPSEIKLHWLPDTLDDLLERERQVVTYFLPYVPFKEKIKLRPKQAVFFIAETATGKTAFWLDVCRANSQGLDYMRKSGIEIPGGCGFISLEMPREELAERGAQFVTGEDQEYVASIMEDQILAEKEGRRSAKFDEVRRLLGDCYRNVWISEDDGVDTKKLKAIIQKGKDDHDIGLWVIDYMGRMKGRGMNQHERLSSLARDMKTVAREMEVILVVLVQVGRASSKDGKPGLRSGRGTGEIEESADILITAHRPDRHEDKELDDDDKQDKELDDSHRGDGYRVTMTAHKVRGGQPGTQSILWFEGAKMRFTPIKEWEAQEAGDLENYADSYEL